MRTSHKLLLRLLHDPDYDFDEVEVAYLDRGAPADRSTVRGREIRAIEGGHFIVCPEGEEKYIPIHRLLEIRYRGRRLWARAVGGVMLE
ncbi:DUF504 domain-containing protein [Methanofollis formosanus]|uniref:DUF504 domain-containing protein n=1 Tax=Methanofollis formosanus TaxID=299308 RepID=A0A8G0ZZL8_9EURY|nr:DUF504 domain-containing protein [Methanofollis formosanus]QYZ77920.1 DUF504 domain-containing protein [Methanofollis formosanus]